MEFSHHICCFAERRAIVGTMASPPVGTTPLASAGAVVERLARLESHVAELQRSKLEALRADGGGWAR